MAANLTDHMPFNLARTVSGLGWQIMGYKEKALQTFLPGTPVMMQAGVVLAWDGVTLNNGILGAALNGGSNLATDGAGAPTNAFSGITGTGATPLFTDKIPNQTSAVSIPHGAKAVDGRNLIAIANNDNIFEGMVDNNTGANFTLLAADIGTAFGLTKDATGHWYVDRAKTGANACVVILQANSVDGFIANARVYFKFLDSVMQLMS